MDFEDLVRQGGKIALEKAAQFFPSESPLHALPDIVGTLRAHSIPYAIIGGAALVAHGCFSCTGELELLVLPEHDTEARTALRRFAQIKLRVAGDFPGDRKPKPITYPDPRDTAVEIDGMNFIELPRLLELKLVVGLTNPARLGDLADVLDAIRKRSLPRELAHDLHAWVRPKYLELWDVVANNPEPQE